MEDKYSLAVAYFNQLINGNPAPEIPEAFSGDPNIQLLHDQVMQLREIVSSFATGDLSHDIRARGFIGGRLKSLQANLRNLTWQVQQVEQEDYSQRVEFMGEFSTAFNNMVLKLDNTLSDLRKKEEELLLLTESLQSEIVLRNNAMQALKESEARFKYLAGHDPLTGVLNRRAFIEQSLVLQKNALNAGKPCGFILLDIDFFKRFNDTYGHATGDLALKHVVTSAQSVLRSKDLMGRYGGEEFVFCLAGAGLKEVTASAERIRKAVASSPLHLAEGPVDITVSVGASVAMPGEEPDEDLLTFIVNEADKNMYEAKQAGKNRVVSSYPGTRPHRRSGDISAEVHPN